LPEIYKLTALIVSSSSSTNFIVTQVLKQNFRAAKNGEANKTTRRVHTPLMLNSCKICLFTGIIDCLCLQL